MEEEEQDYDLKLYRTDGFWYRNAFKTLSNFVNKLKVNIALSKRDLPFDIETMILTMAEKDQDNYNKILNLMVGKKGFLKNIFKLKFCKSNKSLIKLHYCTSKILFCQPVTEIMSEVDGFVPFK